MSYVSVSPGSPLALGAALSRAQLPSGPIGPMGPISSIRATRPSLSLTSPTTRVRPDFDPSKRRLPRVQPPAVPPGAGLPPPGADVPPPGDTGAPGVPGAGSEAKPFPIVPVAIGAVVLLLILR